MKDKLHALTPHQNIALQQSCSNYPHNKQIKEQSWISAIVYPCILTRVHEAIE